MRRLGLLCVVATVIPMLGADDPVFSGPQVGEKLASFKARGVFDADAGKDLDFVAQAAGKPIVLVFVHDVNRQSIGMTRILTQYTVGRAKEKDGLATGVVFLHDDPTEAETLLKRIRHALAPGAPTGVSLEGREGPGSYGLNRNVTLTILVGKNGQVTGNFALIQPSLKVDLPKILASIASATGGKPPRLEDLEGMRELMRPQPSANEAPNLRPLLAPLIRKDATPEAVDAAAKVVEDRATKDEAVRKELGRIARVIVESGRLADYGTPRAQEYLAKWAKVHGGPSNPEPNPPARPGKAP